MPGDGNSNISGLRQTTEGAPPSDKSASEFIMLLFSDCQLQVVLCCGVA